MTLSNIFGGKEPTVCELAGLRWTQKQLCYNTLITGRIGTGKCLGKGTEVMLFSGQAVPVESIRPGDLLMGDDSTPREVISTNVGFGPLYEIQPRKGNPWICNDEHILTLRWNGGKSRKARVWQNGRETVDNESPRVPMRDRGTIDIPLRDFIKGKDIHRNPGSHWCTGWMLYRSPLDLEDNAISANLSASDFYFAGLWIGDGSIASKSVRRLNFTTQDIEIRDWLFKYSNEKGWIYTERNSAKRGTGTKSITIKKPISKKRRHPVRDILGGFGYGIGEKTLPLWALTSTRTKRMALLAGILDTDGHLNCGGFDVVQKRKHLSEQICFLARSLGFWSDVRECKKGCQTGKIGTYYRQHISGDTSLIPNVITRKKAGPRRQPKNVLHSGWRVAPTGNGEYYGFTITGNGRFLLGDFTVTHNTVACLNILQQLFKNVPGWGGLFLDYKSDAHIGLLRLAERHGRKDDVVIIEVPSRGRTKYPPQRINLLRAGGMSPQSVAKIISEQSSNGESKSKNSDFFKKQTEIHIADGIQSLEYMGAPVTISELHRFLCDTNYMLYVLKSLEPMVTPISAGLLRSLHRSGTTPDFRKPQSNSAKVPIIDIDKLSESLEASEPSHPVFRHWIKTFLKQPPEQRGGVISCISNALAPFLTDELLDVFSSEKDDTIDFRDINKGKIICVLCPHTLPREKSALNQYFKNMFFTVGAERYDDRRFENKQTNLLVTFMDECQKSITASDRHALDNLRDANCCFIAAMQDFTSLVPEVGKEVSDVIIGKFCNLLIFKTESEESAKRAADVVGSHRIWKVSHGISGGKKSINKSEADEHILRAEFFKTKLKPHHCVIIHGATNQVRTNVKLPLV